MNTTIDKLEDIEEFNEFVNKEIVDNDKIGNNS